MKLAEALLERTSLDSRIGALYSQWSASQNIDRPVRKPDDIIREMNDHMEKLEELIKRINRTNGQKASNNKKPVELIAEKEMLTMKISALRQLYNAAQPETNRNTTKEIKWVATVDIKSLQKQIDCLAKELRETILELQRMNWEMELHP